MEGVPYRITAQKAAQKVHDAIIHKLGHTIPSQEDVYTFCRDLFNLPVNVDLDCNYIPLDGRFEQYPSIRQIETELKKQSPELFHVPV